MGRGLSDLQKWIICRLGEGKYLTPDYVLINFYGFEKRVGDDFSHEGRNEWFKDGEKVDAQGRLYTTEGERGLWCLSSPIEKCRSAFYHSVKNLKRRGLIQGCNQSLCLTDSGRESYQSMTSCH